MKEVIQGHIWTDFNQSTSSDRRVFLRSIIPSELQVNDTCWSSQLHLGKFERSLSSTHHDPPGTNIFTHPRCYKYLKTKRGFFPCHSKRLPIYITLLQVRRCFWAQAVPFNQDFICDMFVQGGSNLWNNQNASTPNWTKSNICRSKLWWCIALINFILSKLFSLDIYSTAQNFSCCLTWIN